MLNNQNDSLFMSTVALVNLDRLASKLWSTAHPDRCGGRVQTRMITLDFDHDSWLLTEHESSVKSHNLFCIFDENDRKYPGDDTVVAQKNEVKAEEARL